MAQIAGVLIGSTMVRDLAGSGRGAQGCRSQMKSRNAFVILSRAFPRLSESHIPSMNHQVRHGQHQWKSSGTKEAVVCGLVVSNSARMV